MGLSNVALVSNWNDSRESDADAFADKLISLHTVLVSVSNDEKLDSFLYGLSQFEPHLIATDGTEKRIKSILEGSGDLDRCRVSRVSDYTDFPDNLNGRLKTLHPKIQAGVLAIPSEHDHVLKDLNADYIQLVIVNLYPFQQTVARGANFDECIENIDIGGPALIRAAAKNHEYVAVVVDPNDYDVVLSDLLKNSGKISYGTRRHLAAKAIQHTADYDAVIASWFAEQA